MSVEIIRTPKATNTPSLDDRMSLVLPTNSPTTTSTTTETPGFNGTIPNTSTSNPGLLLGIVAGLIVFFALLCTWCCRRKRRRGKGNENNNNNNNNKYPLQLQLPLYNQHQQQQNQGLYPGHGYPQVEHPKQAVIHNQGHHNYNHHHHHPLMAWGIADGYNNDQAEGPKHMAKIPEIGRAGTVGYGEYGQQQQKKSNYYSYQRPQAESISIISGSSGSNHANSDDPRVSISSSFVSKFSGPPAKKNSHHGGRKESNGLRPLSFGSRFPVVPRGQTVQPYRV